MRTRASCRQLFLNSQRHLVSDEGTLGYVGSAFVIVGAIMSLTFGYLADKKSRKMLFVLAILVGEVPCILTGIKYFTPDIYWFTGLRVLSGIGLGALFPLTHSVLADYFTEEHRAFAAAWMGAAWGIGSTIGVAVAGYLTNMDLFGLGWRISFILIGVPNIPLVLAFWAYAKEPEKGRAEDALEELNQEGVVYKQTIKWSDFKIIASNKTNIFTMIQGIPGSIPWGIFAYWPDHVFQDSPRCFSGNGYHYFSGFRYWKHSGWCILGLHR